MTKPKRVSRRVGEALDEKPEVACSADVFWVGETVFVFEIVVATIFEFKTL